MEPGLAELAVSGDPADPIEAVVVARGAGALPVQTIARFGQVATCRVRRDQAAAIAEHQAIRYLSLGTRVAPALFEVCATGASAHCSARASASDRGAGSGVVMAFLDWGIDFTHRAFRDAGGRTRLIALWDQRGGTGNNRYGYGTVYRRRHIDEALLRDHPFEALGYQPRDGVRPAHGTHVADIAAGSGAANGLGVAPGAELVFVHLASSRPGPDGDLGDSVRIIEALDFAVRAAGARPLVINMSLGSTGGSHTGQSPVELALDHLLDSAPGRAVVQSAGNYRQWRTHAQGRLASGELRVLSWWVERDDTTPNELEVWFASADRISVGLVSPSGLRFEARPGLRSVLEIDGERVGRLHHDCPEPLTGDQRVIAYLLSNAEPGEWQMVLRAERIRDGSFHAWIERDTDRDYAQSRFSPRDAVERSTIGTIATSRNAIAVGAIEATALDCRLAEFSSIGPSRDGRVKPDLVAPGVAIRAARSASRGTREGSSEIVAMSGTSMASPHVAGCVAAMFSLALPRRLSITQTRRLLLGSARTHRALEADLAGHGCLDIEAALAAVERFARSSRRNRMSSAHEPQLSPASMPAESLEMPAAPEHTRFSLGGEQERSFAESLTAGDLGPAPPIPGVAPGLTAPALETFQSVLASEEASEEYAEYIPGLGAWADLMSFLPSAALEASLSTRGARLLRLDAGYGEINLDYYPVRIDRLPRGISSPEQLLTHVRLNINRLVERTIAQFHPETPADSAIWSSDNPVGAVIHIDMIDDGSVVCSDASPRHWRFSTVYTRGDWNHPVSGNREWGFVEADGGGWIFYTRGADRQTRWVTTPAGSLVFEGGHQLWLSFQEKLARAVTLAGGRARVMAPTSNRHPWESVLSSGYYRPRRGSAAGSAAGRAEQTVQTGGIPLAPGRGGRSIDTTALEVADIIVSTTAHPASRAIRAVTGGPVSHAMIYVGDGLVVEAISQGVTMRPLAQAISDASLAVAARYEPLTTEQAFRVRDYAGQQIGRRYDWVGLVVPGSFRIYRRLFGDRADRPVHVELGRGRDDSFFCSELVLAAFASAGAPLSRTPAQQAAPYDIARLILTERLSYLGHLRSTAPDQPREADRPASGATAAASP